MKYPYIGKWEDADFTVLFTGVREGFDVKHPYDHKSNWMESNCRNITAEYLANTYGEVKSPEHARFIVELCESNGIKISAFNDKSARSFMISDSALYMLGSSPDDLITGSYKQITIPLSPEKESEIPRSPQHFDCACSKCGGKCCLGGCDNKEERPQVGDEVIFQPDPSINNNKIKATIKYIGKKFTILESDSGREFSRRNAKLLIEKHKTEDEILFDKFWLEINLFMNTSNLNKEVFKSAFINNIIKKPQ